MLISKGQNFMHLKGTKYDANMHGQNGKIYPYLQNKNQNMH